MVKNIKLKNNKGISLASVLVTVILMIIILTSIVYSNNRTNEIKKAMLINSDIEELTKKVEVYYLEKETLPITQTVDEYTYIEDESKFINKNVGDTIVKTADNNTPLYYRLEISLLDNVTLNNKEILSGEESQWYVINPETHTIYFVKREAGKNVIQLGQYNENYGDIILAAISDSSNRIMYNHQEGEPTSSDGNVSLIPGTDDVIGDTSSIDIGNLYGEPGTNIGPDDPTISTDPANYSYKNYIGWNETGTTATNLVLQYDGEYNVARSGTYHDASSKTWYDLTGNGNNGNVVSGNAWGWEYLTFGSGQTASNVNYQYFRKTSSRPEGTSGFESKSLKLINDDYVVCDFYNYNGTVTYNGTTYNNYISGKKTSASVIPDGSEPYTIEIVFKYDGNENKDKGLFGMGTYNNASPEESDNYSKYFKLMTSYRGIKYSKPALSQTINLTADGDWTNNTTVRSYNYDSGATNGLWHDHCGFVAEQGHSATVSHDYYYTNSSGTNLGKDKSQIFNSLITPKNTLRTNIQNNLGFSNNKSNAIKTNKDGLRAYYWAADTDTVDGVLEEGIHTATVEYDGTDTKIYIDGKYICQSSNDPQTYLREISIGATNIKTKVKYIDNISSSSVAARVYTRDTYVCTYHGVITNTDTTSILECYRLNIYSTYEGKRDEVDVTFQYKEFLNNEVYSVRVYNRALTNAEITYNYITDYHRFGSGV